MSLIIDFLLLAASGAACFYCWVLNKRLKALTNSKEGITTGIAALSQSTEEIQSAMAGAKDDAEASSTKLQALIENAEAKTAELEKLSEQIKEISERAVDETETATKNLVGTLSPHIEKARSTAHLLLDAMDKAPQPSEAVEAKPVEEEKTEETNEEAAIEMPVFEDDTIEFSESEEQEAEPVQGAVA